MKRRLALPSSRPLTALVLLAPLAAGQTTVKSGAFGDPTIWDTGSVPGMLATVTISAGHTVGTVPAGMRATPLTVGTLTIDGTLTATFPEGAAGEDVGVLALALTNTGAIRAEPNSSGPGGDVRISAPWGVLPTFPPFFAPLPGSFLNAGAISAGDGASGSSGGTVSIDYRNGLATNIGVIRGGDGSRGGTVTLNATTAENSGGGLLRGGDGDASFGGAARLTGWTFPPGGSTSASNLAGSTLRGGDSNEGRGGRAVIQAFALPPFATGVALNAAGGLVRGGDACQAGSAFLLGMTNINLGALRAGEALAGSCTPVRSSAYFDPPDGIFEDGAQISADVVQFVAGSSLTLRNLAPGAVQANEELQIRLAPGGVLDLSGLQPGSLSAGSGTSVAADTVLLPPGLDLDDLVSGGPVTVSGGVRHAEPMPHGGQEIAATAGETVRMELVVEHAGNLPEDYELRVEGPPSWPAFSSPLVFATSIGAAGLWSSTIEFEVPFGTAPGSEHEIVVSATTTTVGQPQVSASASHFVTVRDVLCAGKMYGAPGALLLHVEPGAAVTAPMLALDGGQPFAPLILAVSASAVPEGFVLPGLPTIYIDVATATLVQLFFDGSGRLAFPVTLSGIPGLSFSIQAFQLTDLASSNGLTLTMCQ